MRHVGREIRARVTPILVALVVLGLVSIPVECAVAAGPHSIFADARSVSALQGEAANDGHAAHGHDHHGSTSSRLAAPDRTEPESDSTTGPTSDGGASVAQQRDPAPPSTAGVASDAITGVSLPVLEDAPRTEGTRARVPTDVPWPPGHLLPGPEPPPP